MKWKVENNLLVSWMYMDTERNTGTAEQWTLTRTSLKGTKVPSCEGCPESEGNMDLNSKGCSG